MRFFWCLAIYGFLGIASASGQAGQVSKISLEDYLKQVGEKNGIFRGAELSEGAAELRKEEWTLLTSPAMFGSAQRFKDQREVSSPTLQGNDTTVNTYSLGISQQTRFGLAAKLSYNYNDTTIKGANPAFLAEPHFFITGPYLELTQSFGKNGFGGETQATQRLQEAQALSALYLASFRQSSIGAEAESAYWRLALAREALDAARENLERAERIRTWSAGRTKLDLADRADFLQAEAALLARRLEAQAAIDEEKVASRVFNTLRGEDADIVVEMLNGFDESTIQRLKVPEKRGVREDVKAAEQEQIAARANAELARQRNKPTLDAYVNVGLNGRDPRSGESISESFTDKHPHSTVGVRFSLPLDIGQQASNRRAYESEAHAAELIYQQRLFEERRLWNDLSKKFSEARQRLEMARQIELAQRKKLDHEKNRHSRGRTTTYQVILFEQDFASSQLARIRAQAEVLNIFAQLKTFGGGQ